MSTPAEIRAQAAQLLIQVAEQGKSLDALLENRGDAPQERGLLRSLSYGSVRWYWRLYEVLGLLSSQPVRELQPEVRALAIVGLYQLLHTDIAAHAAVAETVEAVRVLNVPRAAGLLNAVLRRCQREADALQKQVDRDLSARTGHPHWLVEHLQHDWPKQCDAMLAANNEHPPFWLRVNVRKISRAAYIEQLSAIGVTAQISTIAPEALWLPQAMDVAALPGFKEGWVSIQDGAAQLAAHLLDAQPGERILDACAAPGGKTCHILELQPELQELVAVDISNGRLRRVKNNLDRLGLHATLCCGDASKPETWWNDQLFDRILLDVPCSATGVIRRHPDIKLLRRGSDIAKLAARQAQMLEQMWHLLKPGGRLVYASCSLLKAENADNVQFFLAQHDNAQDLTAAVINEQANAAAWSRLPPAPMQTELTEGTIGLVIQTGHGRASATTNLREETNVETGGFDGFYYACLRKRH
jgi:16S rRNA (cytosine967-C5)-methyltransferase